MKYKLEWEEKSKYFTQVRTSVVHTDTEKNAKNILKKEFGKSINILNCEEIVEKDNENVDVKR